jgi:transcriptional regulator with XRE-family HTH domain
MPTESRPEPTPLRRIIELTGWLQKEFAKALGVEESALSRAAKRSTISDDYRKLIGDFVRQKGGRLGAAVAEKILEILEEVGPFDERVFRLGAQKERLVEMPEADAWSFALQFRNATMLDRLSSHAEAVGLTSFRMADGVRFEGEKREQVPSWSDALFPCPHRVGLDGGLVVLLGDPQNHPTAGEVFGVFQGYMRSYRCNVKVSIFPGKQNYVGYPTNLKSLTIDGKVYQPTRCLQPDPTEPPAMQYEDYGVVFSAGRERLVKGAKPFGESSRHVVFICGLHRAATGVGLMLLEDLDFRQRVLAGTQFDFPSGDRIGVLAYRVRLRMDNRSWITSGSDWRHSRIEAIDVLKDWIQPIPRRRFPKHKVRMPHGTPEANGG